MSEHEGGSRPYGPSGSYPPSRRPPWPPQPNEPYDPYNPVGGPGPRGGGSGAGSGGTPPSEPPYGSRPRNGRSSQYPPSHRDEPRDPRVGGSRARRRSERTFGSAIGLTILGTIIPGSGLIAAGKKIAGGIVLAIAVGLLGFAAYFGIFRKADVIRLAVDKDKLQWIGQGLFILGLAWVVLVVVTYRSLRPWRISPLSRIGGSILVMALALTIMVPMARGSRLATVQGDLVSTIFRDQSDIRSETAPKNRTADNPWGGADRVNILLLGGDGGKGRSGVRTDTVMVASINTKTGNTALVALPRNLEQVPFKPGSKLAKKYPDGVFDPGRKFNSDSEELEYMLTAMYENVPEQNPGLLKSDNPGADVLKEAVGEALGLKLDYYVLLNLKGFEKLLDALGGVTVNVNNRVPIGGDASKGIEPSKWIEQGANKHLNGYEALWFARGRYGSSDYQRMRRQRCTVNAIIKQANPQQVLDKYEAVAKASKESVRTDIPDALLGPFVELSLKVKDAKVQSVVFDNKVITPWRPDYDLIRAKVASSIEALDKPAQAKQPKPAGKPSAPPSGEPDPSASSKPGEKDPPKSIEASCAYHPDVDE